MVIWFIYWCSCIREGGFSGESTADRGVGFYDIFAADNLGVFVSDRVPARSSGVLIRFLFGGTINTCD